jgi:hypothetical protein
MNIWLLSNRKEQSLQWQLFGITKGWTVTAHLRVITGAAAYGACVT